DRDELRGIYAEELAAGSRGIRQRPEQVEERAQPELLAHRRDVAHGRVMPRGKEEPDAALVDARRDGSRRQLHLYSQRGEHVGAAAPGGDRTVAVLGDARSSGGSDERRRGGDVERV